MYLRCRHRCRCAVHRRPLHRLRRQRLRWRVRGGAAITGAQKRIRAAAI